MDGAHSTVIMGMVGAVGHVLCAGASKKCAKNHSGKRGMFSAERSGKGHQKIPNEIKAQQRLRQAIQGVKFVLFLGFVSCFPLVTCRNYPSFLIDPFRFVCVV